MKATFVLTPAEARRLIAKAVIQMPEFKKAWENAYVILAGGTTNAFIAQELGYDVEPGRCTVGTSTSGLLCVTEPSDRKSFPNVFYKGQPSDKKINEALEDFHADTVIIKGANAFDLDGHVGVITSGFNGGTIPNFIGYMTSKGLSEINSTSITNAYGKVYAGYSNYTMRISYGATVNADDSLVYGENGNDNKVVLTWKRTSTEYYDTLVDDCHVCATRS
jgi:hypothetical protein